MTDRVWFPIVMCACCALVGAVAGALVMLGRVESDCRAYSATTIGGVVYHCVPRTNTLLLEKLT